MEPNIVKLSTVTVELIPFLNWGQQEQLRSAVYGGLRVKNLNKTKDGEPDPDVDFDISAVSQSKYKALEVCIKKITDAEGKEISYSKEWMNSLSIEDGDALYSAVDAVTSKKK